MNEMAQMAGVEDPKRAIPETLGRVAANGVAGTGVKHDGEKLPTELLDPSLLEHGTPAMQALARWAKGGDLRDLHDAIDWISADLQDVSEVLQAGAAKYGRHNWRGGMAWSRPYAAALRHLFAEARGELLDAETRLPHRAHAACEVMFLIAYARDGVGLDDRRAAIWGDRT